MKIGDVSRPRRFANPARLRWYAFHRSVRFALRMMKAEKTSSCPEVRPHFALPTDIIQSQEPADLSHRQELDSDDGYQARR